MPDFAYQALTEEHVVKTGQISAVNTAEAVALLESQGLEVQMICQVGFTGEVGSQSESSTLHGEAESYAPMDEDEFLRDRIAGVLEQRDTLAPALAAFAEELPAGRPRRDLRRLSTRLSAGATADDLCQSPEMTAAWIPLLGGASLGSSNFLHDLFAEASRDTAVRTQRTRVLAYPLLVFALAMGVLILLCLIVVPTFSDIFQDFDLQLPELSNLVVAFSNELRFHFLRVLLLLAGGIIVVYVVLRLVLASGLPDRLFGSLTKGSSRQVSAMASFVRRLAETLQAGFPLPTALRLVGRASGRGWLNLEANALALALETDAKRPLSSKLPPTLLYALRAGPGGVPNLRLVQELAELYAERVSARYDWSTGFVPQFAILCVGFVVGMIVLGMFLPLVQLINALTG